jgi:uncharacterized OB-fold protein
MIQPTTAPDAAGTDRGEPIIDGWFTLTSSPSLIGRRCPQCGTYVFPPRAGGCPSPLCDAAELEPVELSRTGRIWSYTENRYAPPPPYVAADPFEPYALAAVELEAEGLVVLGRVARGVLGADLHVGMPMQLELDVSHREGDVDKLVYVWAPAAPARTEADR